MLPLPVIKHHNMFVKSFITGMCRYTVIEEHITNTLLALWPGFPSQRATDSESVSVSWCRHIFFHYDDVIMGVMASQITSLTIVYSTVYSDADQRKPQSSASLAFVRGFHRGPVNSPHKWPVTRKMLPFHDVIMHIFQRFCSRQYIIPLIHIWGKSIRDPIT